MTVVSKLLENMTVVSKTLGNYDGRMQMTSLRCQKVNGAGLKLAQRRHSNGVGCASSPDILLSGAQSWAHFSLTEDLFILSPCLPPPSLRAPPLPPLLSCATRLWRSVWRVGTLASVSSTVQPPPKGQL